MLSYAIMRGYRAPPNPATWRGQLEVLLPQKAKVAPVRHHAALPYAELPSFYARLTERSAPGALALRFLILTAARSNEVRGMRWGEVDWDAGVWTVPAARMKVGTEHRVPLSGPAVTLLREQAVLQVAGPGRDAVGEEALGEKAINEAATSTDPAPAALVFPNASGTGPMSDGVWRALFRRMGCPEITAHGFRSTFRDSCGEETTHPRELAEHALAHEVGNAVERAYRRGDALERRRRVVQDWGAFVTGG